MNILITGTSSGVGLELAKYLSSKNHQVIGLSRKNPNSKEFQTIICDITNQEQVKNAFLEIKSHFNTIDVLINNAGAGMVGSIENTQSNEINKLFNLNFIAPIGLLNEVLPLMRKQNYGKVLMISSIGSEMGLPFRGFYSASKSALDKIVEALRYEVSNFNIQVASIHLGDVQTGIAESRIQSNVSSDYKKIFDKVLNSMNEHVNQGVTTNEVARFIETIITKKTLKAHYYFGKFGQKIAKTLKNILPYFIFEQIIKKYSGI